jgi:hypothetical protein
MRCRTVAPLLLLAALAAPVEAERLIRVESFELRVGEATNSSPIRFHQVRETGCISLEAEVVLPPDLRRESQPLGIYFAGLASHELFWDGERIGGGGVVGCRPENERPGPIEAHYQLPDRLAAPGPHRLLVRASAHRRGFMPSIGYWVVLVGDFEEIVHLRRGQALVVAVALGGLLLTGFFALALLLAARGRVSLRLALLAFTAAALLLCEAWRSLFGYSYDWHIWRLWGVLILSFLTGFQVLALVAARLRRGGSDRALLAGVSLGAAAGAALVASWDGKSLAVHAAFFGAALLLAAAALWRRRPGAGLLLLGLAVTCTTLALRPFEFLDYALFFSLDFLFLCLLWDHAREVRAMQREKAAAELAATRLQLEMVRRQIQPHFLMNTLTALAEWVETEPAAALRMIEAIAEEFRLLGEFSEREMVSLEEELRLCRCHLETMGLRKDVRYRLEVEGAQGNEVLPPAVLHTLVENAVKHGAASPEVTLRLAVTRDDERVRYRFGSPATLTGDSVKPGTGTRYIEARLRQAWGEDWSFRQGPANGGWRAELELPAGDPK